LLELLQRFFSGTLVGIKVIGKKPARGRHKTTARPTQPVPPEMTAILRSLGLTTDGGAVIAA
jgi:hypothetical protein